MAGLILVVIVIVVGVIAWKKGWVAKVIGDVTQDEAPVTK